MAGRLTSSSPSVREFLQLAAQPSVSQTEAQWAYSRRLSTFELQNHGRCAVPLMMRFSLRATALQEILDRGWWRAHDSGRLDDDGVPTDDDDFGLGSEGERMAQVGDILGIPGDITPYPYAEWLTSAAIQWPAFEFVAYAPEGQAG